MGNLLEVITEGRREAPCAPWRRGRLSFSLSQRAVFLCGVLVACVLPRTWSEYVLVGRWEGHAWPLEESPFKSMGSLTHLSPPVCLPGLPFQFLPGLVQSQEKSEWYSRDGVPKLPYESTPPLARSPSVMPDLMPKARCPLPPLGGTSWSPGRK